MGDYFEKDVLGERAPKGFDRVNRKQKWCPLSMIYLYKTMHNKNS